MSACWRKTARTIYLSAIGILIHLSTSTSDIEPLLHSCCKLGTTWGNNIPNCGNYPTPIPQVPKNQQSVCLSVLEICCTQVHRHRMCKRGKETAQSGQECSVIPTLEGVTHKDCCDGCKIGLIVAGMNMPCLLSNFPFQSPWHEAYIDCCSLNYNSQGGNSDDRCETNNPCSQKCIDTGLVIQCSCYSGFVLASDQRTCEDINECLLGTHACNALTETCHNTIGSFQCFRKGEESQLLDDDCQLGYYKNLQTGECNDLDECTLGTHSCIHEAEVCLNTPGSYTCSQNIGFQCQPGFKPGNRTGVCIDVDECAEGLDNCLPSVEVCLNNHGSYQCQDRSSQDCPAGFKWSTDLGACEG
ncbi:fibulin-1-like, partial [Limulus polyphemus]|uniref:Fibulin-1-like n=1 Tax=Limulus polyphemus TaxID=6850 RepID=A0ABM1TQ07_LIMPO